MSITNDDKVFLDIVVSVKRLKTNFNAKMIVCPSVLIRARIIKLWFAISITYEKSQSRQVMFHGVFWFIRNRIKCLAQVDLTSLRAMLETLRCLRGNTMFVREVDYEICRKI